MERRRATAGDFGKGLGRSCAGDCPGGLRACAGGDPHGSPMFEATGGDARRYGRPRSTAAESHSVDEPALHFAGQRQRIDLEDDRLDPLGRPPVGEGADDLVAPDAAWSPVAGLAVTEAEQVAAPAGAEHGVQSIDVTRPIVIVENVEQPAVDHHVEAGVGQRHGQHVARVEPDVETALSRLAPGAFDGNLRKVDAQRVRAVGRGQESVLAGAATGIEDVAGQQAGVGEPLDRRLRSMDVPRGVGVALVGRIPALSLLHRYSPYEPADCGYRRGHSDQSHGGQSRTSPGPTTSRTLLLAERLREIVAAHLRPAGDVAPLGLFVELGTRLGRRTAGALALRDRRALLAEGCLLRLRHVGERAALLRAGLRLFDVALGRLDLPGARHRWSVACQRPTARSSSALFIFDRPSTPLLFASL